MSTRPEDVNEEMTGESDSTSEEISRSTVAPRMILVQFHDIRGNAELNSQSAKLKTETEAPGVYNSKAEREAAVVRQILDICEERIDYNQSLINYLETAKTVREMNFISQHLILELGITYPRLCNDVQAVAFKIALLPGIVTDRDRYRELKKILLQYYREEYFLDVVYTNISILMNRENSNFTAKEFESNHERYHYKRILDLLEPLFTAVQLKYRREYDTLMLQEEYTREVPATLLCYLRDYLLKHFCKDPLKTLGEYIEQQSTFLLPEEKKPFMAFVEAMPRLLQEIVDSIGDDVYPVQPSPQMAQLLASVSGNNERHASRVENIASTVVSNKDIQDIGKINKEKNDIEAKKINEVLLVDRTLRDFFYKILAYRDRIQSNRDILEQYVEVGKKRKAAETFVRIQREQTRKKEEEARLKVQQDELEAFLKKREAELAAYQEKIVRDRAEREKYNKESIAYLAQELSKESHEKETAELSEIELDQLLVMARLLGHYKGVLEDLFQLNNVKFDTLEILIKRLQGTLTINESSHFCIRLPNTYRVWNKTKKEQEESKCYELSNRDMTKGGGWTPHGRAHNDDILPRHDMELCTVAFERAGITPSRIQRALELRLNQEQEKIRRERGGEQAIGSSSTAAEACAAAARSVAR